MAIAMMDGVDDAAEAVAEELVVVVTVFVMEEG